MTTWFRRPRATSDDWLALSLHGDRVDVAHVERRAGERPAVQACDSYSTKGGERETLARLRKSLSAARHRCANVLARGEYQLQLVDAPAVPATELKQAVRWKLKDLLDYPVDAATVDVAGVPADRSGTARGHYVYAVSARSQQIAARMKLFRDARFPLHAIDVPEMAQRNIAGLFEEAGRGLAMLVCDDQGGMLTFTAGGELYMARGTDITLGQLTTPSAQKREQALERLVLELQRSIDHFDRQFGYVTLARLLIAPLPPELGVQAYLSQNLDLPVQSFDLAQVMDFPGAPELRDPQRQSLQLHVIGAALRDRVAA
jgi:MSHA biogenesis protein MshI